jgi:hypothetical protein
MIQRCIQRIRSVGTGCISRGETLRVATWGHWEGEKRRRRMAVGIRSEVARKKKMNRTGNLPAG